MTPPIGLRSGRVLLIALCAFAGLVVATHFASAGEIGGGAAALLPIPVTRDASGVLVRSLAVDATLSDSGSEVIAQTRVALRLRNPTRLPVTVTMSLPGPQAFSTDLPELLEAAQDDRRVEITQPAEELPAQITLRVKSGATTALVLTYSQRLPRNRDLSAYTYMLSGLSRWPGQPESVRIEVGFDGVASPGRVLSRSPLPQRQSAAGFTWLFEYEKPDTPIGVLFLTPDTWRELAEDRAAAASDPGSAAARARLGELYARLASLTPPSFAGSIMVSEPFEPAAIAELEAATGLLGDSPEAARLDVELAELYATRAAQQPEHEMRYLDLAARRIESALRIAGSDAGLRESVAQFYRRTTESALAAGRPDLAAAIADRSTATLGDAGKAEANASAALAPLSAAADALHAGDMSLARRLVEESLGTGSTALDGVPPPAAAQSFLSVDISADSRRFSLTFHGIRDEVRLAAILADSAAALRSEEAGTITASATELSVERARNVAPLQESALPQAPEILLLKTALTASPDQLDIGQSPLRHGVRYREEVDLSACEAAWAALAADLESAATGLSDGIGLPEALRPLPATALGLGAEVIRALWLADAQAWREFARSSAAVYRLENGIAGDAQEWHLVPGERRVLTAGAQEADTRTRQAALLAAGGLALILGLAAWQLTRR